MEHVASLVFDKPKNGKVNITFTSRRFTTWTVEAEDANRLSALISEASEDLDPIEITFAFMASIKPLKIKNGWAIGSHLLQ